MITVRPHGKTTLEIESRIPIDQRRRRRFVLEAYFFFPQSLGIDGEVYDSADFFEDTRSRTRLTASCIPLPRLIEEDCAVSPLTRIRKEITRAALPNAIDGQRILYELRSLINLYEAETEATMDIISSIALTGSAGQARDRTRRLVKEIKAFLAAWRKLQDLFWEPSVADNLREAFTWTDESISIITERIMHGLTNAADHEEKRILKLMESELDYRKTVGFELAGLESEKQEVERRIHRESILKKWGQSALYLDKENSPSDRRLNHILAGAAAAAAMSFAVVATILAERRFPGHSLPWALAIIVSYIFKDRIKEVLRTLLVRTVPGLVSDKTVRLVDQATGKRVGRITDSVHFSGASRIPVDITGLRDGEDATLLRFLPEENVLKYRRRTSLRCKRLLAAHQRFESVTDIVRIRLNRILQGMDDLRKTLQLFSTDEPAEVTGRRLYPVELIVLVDPNDGTLSSVLRFRLMLSREGLERIDQDEVPARPPVAPRRLS